MDWDDIRYFLALARTGSLSRAARELGVTHVTVSRRITRLEESFKVRLFDRRQSGYQLTAAGKRLLPESEAVEQRCQRFQRQLLGQSDLPEGTLTVSVPESAVVDLTPAIAAFMAAYPGIELTVLETPEQLNLNQLQAEVVIRITDNPPDLLVGRQLTDLSFNAYGHRDYIATLNGDFSQADWGVWQPDAEMGQAEAYLAKSFNEPRISLRTRSNGHLLSMVRQGAVMGVLSSCAAERYPELQAAFPESLIRRKFWLLTHRDLKDAARVRCFMQFMKDKLQ